MLVKLYEIGEVSIQFAWHESFSCNISNTRKTVSSDIQTLQSEETRRSRVFFFNQLQSVWISDETFFRVFDMASQMILREIQRKSSPNFMIIRITHPNLLHGNDFFCFLFMNH